MEVSVGRAIESGGNFLDRVLRNLGKTAAFKLIERWNGEMPDGTYSPNPDSGARVHVSQSIDGGRIEVWRPRPEEEAEESLAIEFSRSYYGDLQSFTAELACVDDYGRKLEGRYSSEAGHNFNTLPLRNIVTGMRFAHNLVKQPTHVSNET